MSKTPIYISFTDPSPLKQRELTILLRSVWRIFSFFLPEANPDFDKLYDDVVTWILEFENREYPNREVGLDENERVLVKGPYGKNLGFWLDTDMGLKDFEKFEPEVIDASFFEKHWEREVYVQ